MILDQQLFIADGRQGAWTVPGTVSAAPIAHPIGTYSSTNALGGTASSLPMHAQSSALLPLVYWYGHSTMQRNPMLLQRLIRNLGESISDRWDFDAEGRSSGLIVDTPASFAGTIAGQKNPDARNALLKACVDAFRSEKIIFLNGSVWNVHCLLVNVILVVGHERLSVEMQRTFGERCTVVKVPKSGGVCHIPSCPCAFCTQAYRIIRLSSWTTLKGNVYRRGNYTATCMGSQSLRRMV